MRTLKIFITELQLLKELLIVVITSTGPLRSLQFKCDQEVRRIVADKYFEQYKEGMDFPDHRKKGYDTLRKLKFKIAQGKNELLNDLTFENVMVVLKE